MVDVQCVWQIEADLGEGPLWVARDASDEVAEQACRRVEMRQFVQLKRQRVIARCLPFVDVTACFQHGQHAEQLAAAAPQISG